jgi:hypothetical protein
MTHDVHAALVPAPGPPASTAVAWILAASAVFVAIATILAYVAIRDWRQDRRPHLAIIMIAINLGFLTDGASHWLLGIRFTDTGKPLVIYDSFGLQTPLWMLPYYPAYIASGAYLTLWALRERWSRARFWRLYLLLAAADAAGEYIMIKVARLYVYSGPQPLDVAGLPLTWPLMYAATGVLLGALLSTFGHHLSGPRWLLTVPLIGSGVLGFLGILAWPSIISMHTTMPPRLIWWSGVATAATTLAAVALVATRLDRHRTATAEPTINAPAEPTARPDHPR